MAQPKSANPAAVAKRESSAAAAAAVAVPQPPKSAAKAAKKQRTEGTVDDATAQARAAVLAAAAALPAQDGVRFTLMQEGATYGSRDDTPEMLGQKVRSPNKKKFGEYGQTMGEPQARAMGVSMLGGILVPSIPNLQPP